MSLKSTQGPIDVFLCPEDNSGACSPVSSPTKTNTDPSLVPPIAQPTDQSKASRSTATLQASSLSPASTSSTVTTASQQDTSSLVVGSDSGECSCFNLRTFDLISKSWPGVNKKKKKKSINPKRHTVISKCVHPLPSLCPSFLSVSLLVGGAHEHSSANNSAAFLFFPHEFTF